MLIAAIAIVATAACSVFLFYNILEKQIFEDLRANAHVIAMMGPGGLPAGTAYDPGADGLRVTRVGRDGTVTYDSLENEEAMVNHGKRPEVGMAFETGEGRAVRKSETSSKHTFYYAMLTDRGEVLRIGKEDNSMYHFMFHMAGLILVVGVGVFAMCVFYSHRMTKRLMRPIEKMADNLVLIDDMDVYEEMRPFISTLKQQHVDILNHARMRQEFTANVSHELKTPLTAISGYAELIASGITNEKDTLHFADEIHRSAERLQSLIDDIIKLSELDDGSLKLEFEMLDLYETAENCKAMMEMQAQKNEVALRIEGEHTLLNGNRTLIDELIYNLCSNAVRYNKKGGSVTITAGLEKGRPFLSVKDTGIGIPADQQDRVFERFYRVDKSRSKSTGGTGLGLAIVKHIVSQHEAQLQLFSKEGEGTEIRVIF